MPFQNFFNELNARKIAGKSLKAEQKCGEVVIWVGVHASEVTYDELRTFFSDYIEQYVRNNSKPLYLFSGNKLTRPQADAYKDAIINSWAEKCDATLEQILQVINDEQSGFSAEQKDNIFKSWYKNPNNQLSEEQLISLIRGEFIQPTSTQSKNEIVQLFFEKNNCRPPQSHLIMFFLINSQIAATKTVVQNHSFEELLRAFNENNAFLHEAKWDAETKYKIFEDWMAVPANKDSLGPQELRTFIDLNPQLDVKRLLGSENRDLKLAAEFCANKYDGVDYLKVDFFTNFIRDKFPREFSAEVLQILLPLMQSISNPDQAAVMVRELRNYFALNPAQMSVLAKSTTLTKYPSLRELLDSKKIHDVVKEDKMAGLHQTFGDEVFEMTALDVFAYYNVTEKRGSKVFSRLLKPDFQTELDAAYLKYLEELDVLYLKSPATLCYMTKSEHDHLRFLFNNLNLPKTSTLADDLKSKIKILSIRDSEIPTFEINFRVGFNEREIAASEEHSFEHNNKTYDLPLREQISTRYRDILSKPNPRNLKQIDNNILSFFILLCKKKDDYFDALDEEKIKEFCEFVYKNKKEIAFILKQYDGIEFISRMFFSLEDGCSKNITSVFNAGLIDYSIRNIRGLASEQQKANRILFQVYNYDIFASLVNYRNANHGEFYVGRTDNPLDHPKVKQSRIRPQEFVYKVANNFRDQVEKNQYMQNAFAYPVDPKKTAEDNVVDFEQLLYSVEDLGEGHRFDNLVAYVVLGLGSLTLQKEFEESFLGFQQAKKDAEEIRNKIRHKKFEAEIEARKRKAEEDKIKQAAAAKEDARRLAARAEGALLNNIAWLKEPENNIDVNELFAQMRLCYGAKLNTKIDFLAAWLSKGRNYLSQYNFELLFRQGGFIGTEQFAEGDAKSLEAENPRQYLESVIRKKDAAILFECQKSRQKYIEALEAEMRGELKGAVIILYEWLQNPDNYFTFNDLERLFNPGGALAHFYPENRLQTVALNLAKEQNNFSADQLFKLLTSEQFLGTVLYITKPPLIMQWLDRGENNFSYEQIIFLLSPASSLFLNRTQCYEIISKSLQKRENNISSRQIIELLPYVGEKASLILQWLQKEGNNFSLEEQNYLLNTGEVFVYPSHEHQQVDRAIREKNMVRGERLPDFAESAAAVAAAAPARVRRAPDQAVAPTAIPAENPAGMKVSLGRRGKLVVQDLLKPFKDFISASQTPAAKCDAAIAWLDEEENNLTFSQFFGLFIAGGVLSSLDIDNKFRLTSRWLEKGNNNFFGAELENLSRSGRVETHFTPLQKQELQERSEAKAYAQNNLGDAGARNHAGARLGGGQVQGRPF